MRSAWVEHKDFSGLAEKFTLAFSGRSVDVYIWKSVKALRKNTHFSHNNQVGAYVFFPYRKPRSGLFGEIHLLKRLIGAGYVAHEIQHFLYDWLTEQTHDKGLNERLALLAGNITKEFWNAYLHA